MSGWIGVDLDATLAGWGDEHPTDVGKIGPPIPKMVAQVKDWLAKGHEVRIFTARVGPATPEECHAALIGREGCQPDVHYNPETHDAVEYFLAGQRRLIEDWCLEHLGVVLPITATKDFHTVALYDDRAVQIRGNCGEGAVAHLTELLDLVIRDRVAVWETLKALGEPVRDTDTDLVAAVTRYVDRAHTAVVG